MGRSQRSLAELACAPAPPQNPGAMDPRDLLPPPEGRTRETAIRRDARGRWWNGADAITHPLLTRAFDAWIERADDGRYCLKNDVNWAYVAIEGAPFFVRACRLGPAGAELELSDGTRERLDPSTLLEDAEGALYCRVKGGRFLARLDAHAAMQLGEALDERLEGLVLRLGETCVSPRRVADPLAEPEPR